MHSYSDVAISVLDALDTWLKTDVGKATRLPGPSFHMAVFRLFAEHRCSAMRVRMLTACRFGQIESKGAFADEVANLARWGRFSRALEAADCLGLHAEFPKETFLLPLIVENKIGLVEAFLERAPKGLQADVVSWLDWLMVRKSSLHVP